MIIMTKTFFLIILGIMDRMPKKEQEIEAMNEETVDPFAQFPNNVNPQTGNLCSV